MAARLPAALQPFLTWLTARPAPHETLDAPARDGASRDYVAGALGWTIGGCLMALLPLLWTAAPWPAWILLPLGLLATSCGLGLFQVVVFHHCSHGTVFKTRARNRQVGRWVSSILLFKRFDDYQREHMLHHSPNKLLTEEDEFADFVLGLCGLSPGMAKRELWRRVLVTLVSPEFHWRFLNKRVRAGLFSGDAEHDRVGRLFWGASFAIAAASGLLLEWAIVWVLPVTILLQQATILRILCEHCFPEEHLIAARGREFVAHATTGVFPGVQPPWRRANTLHGIVAWTAWWADMLTVQLFARVFVLVGDAPCHDFHHRRPATRRWTDYIHAREHDLQTGSPGFPHAYNESWGLWRAIDRNLATLAATRPEAIGR